MSNENSQSKCLSTEIEVKVPFYDLDPMKVVWHGNYVKYFEKVRCELLEQLDYNYQQMEDSGYMWPVVDMRLKYVNFATFGQLLKCRATIKEYENRLKIEYLITCSETGKRLTKGYTVQVAVAIENKELQLVSPPILLRKLGVSDA